MTGRAAPKEPTEPVHLRLPRSIVRRADHWAVEEDKYRNEMIATLLKEALDARGLGPWEPSGGEG